MKKKLSYKSNKLIDIPKEQWVRIEGTHEAIIEKDVFDAAGRRLREHTRSDGKGETHGLSGKLRCMDCNAGMIRVSCVYKEERRSYLQCARYADARNDPFCTRHSIRLDRLMEAVEDKLRLHVEHYYTPGDISRFALRDDGAARRAAAITKELAAAGQQANRLAAAIRSLYLDKVDGTISQELFAEMSHGFATEQEKLALRIQGLEQDAQEINLYKACDTELEERVQEILQLAVIGRELFDLLIDTVEIGEKDSAALTQEIRIHWKF